MLLTCLHFRIFVKLLKFNFDSPAQGSILGDSFNKELIRIRRSPLKKRTRKIVPLCIGGLNGCYSFAWEDEKTLVNPKNLQQGCNLRRTIHTQYIRHNAAAWGRPTIDNKWFSKQVAGLSHQHTYASIPPTYLCHYPTNIPVPLSHQHTYASIPPT